MWKPNKFDIVKKNHFNNKRPSITHCIHNDRIKEINLQKWMFKY